MLRMQLTKAHEAVDNRMKDIKQSDVSKSATKKTRSSLKKKVSNLEKAKISIKTSERDQKNVIKALSIGTNQQSRSSKKKIYKLRV